MKTKVVFSYSNVAIMVGDEEGCIEIHTTSGIVDALTETLAKERAMDICLNNYPADQGYVGHNIAVHGPFAIVIP